MKTYVVLCGNFHSILGDGRYNQAIKHNDALHHYEPLFVRLFFAECAAVKNFKAERSPAFHEIPSLPAGLLSFCLMAFFFMSQHCSYLGKGFYDSAV